MSKHANIALFVPHAGCPHQCCFCNQRSISGQSEPLSPCQVGQAVETALNGREKTHAQLAFFGGSFTAIDRDTMVGLLRAAQPYVENGQVNGIRISTRPDAIDEQRLRILKQYGVTDIELGCQSMNDNVLVACSRGHTADDTVKAAALIHDFGFHLGVQMMTGLPGDSDDGCILTAKKLIALKPDTARIYPTVVLKGTPLAESYLRGEYQPPKEEDCIRLCSQLLLLFEQAGIPVIRLGLHAEAKMQNDALAGFYHPAFRELCQGEIFYQKAKELLCVPGLYQVTVGKGRASQFAGQNRRNLLRLSQEGFNCRIREDESLSEYELRIQNMRIR